MRSVRAIPSGYGFPRWCWSLVVLLVLPAGCLYVPAVGQRPFKDIDDLQPGGDLVTREDAFLRLGVPDGVAPDDESLVWIAQRRMGYLLVGGYSTGAVAKLQKDYFLVLRFDQRGALAGAEVLDDASGQNRCLSNGLCLTDRVVEGHHHTGDVRDLVNPGARLRVLLAPQRARLVIDARASEGAGQCHVYMAALLHLAAYDAEPDAYEDVMEFSLDGTKALPVANGTFSMVNLPPGQHTVRVDSAPVAEESVVPARAGFSCAQGENVYLAVSQHSERRGLLGIGHVNSRSLSVQVLDAEAGDASITSTLLFRP